MRCLTLDHLPSPRECARLLRGELDTAGVISCPGPGHSSADRSLRVWLTEDGPRVHSFAGDDPLLCRDHVCHALGLAPWQPGHRQPVVRPPERSPATDEDARHRREVARRLWGRSLPGRGSLAEVYLRSRGIVLDPWPATLRFLPARPPDHIWPTMIAPFGMPTETAPGLLRLSDSTVVGVHLTYLRSDGGGKAPIDPAKRMIGRGHNTPVVLAPMTDSLGLIIAEGIEDALSLHIETGLGVWAAGCASRMPALAEHVPAYADHVTVVADDDDAGRQGAASLRETLRTRGISAEILDLRRCRDGSPRR